MTSLILGLSTRAMAESAISGGHRVITLDYFGDLDQRALAENYSLARDYRLPFNAENLLKASSRLKFDKVVYTSNLENHPNVVEKIASRAQILGNGPEVLHRIRNWIVLREFCRQKSIPHPPTLLPGEENLATPQFQWLRKPVRSGGGSGIKPWDGQRLKRKQVLQAYVHGLPASAAFVSDGKKGVVIGLTHQLIGRHELGATGFTWCGNILPLPMDYEVNRFVLGKVEKMVNQLIEFFGLKGVGGIDIVIADGPDGRPQPTLIEINPRYTGAMELVEIAYGLNIYNLHLAAAGGSLPQVSLNDYPDRHFYGKGIVYSLKSLTIQKSEQWAAHGWKDIPFPGDKIDQGRPVCSVFGHGPTYKECMTDLLMNAAQVRQVTEDIGDLRWTATLN